MPFKQDRMPVCALLRWQGTACRIHGQHGGITHRRSIALKQHIRNHAVFGKGYGAVCCPGKVICKNKP